MTLHPQDVLLASLDICRLPRTPRKSNLPFCSIRCDEQRVLVIERKISGQRDKIAAAFESIQIKMILN